MASACVNNGPVLPDFAFLDFAPACAAYGWLGPRISFSRDLADEGDSLGLAGEESEPPASSGAATPGSADTDESGKDLPDFEFRLDDPVAMLPADELFSDGKLVPLQIAAARSQAEPADGIRSPEAERPRCVPEVLGSEVSAVSPKEPRCSSRWRELLGLNKRQNPKPEPQYETLPPSKSLNPKTRSLRHLLRRHPKLSAADSSLGIPHLHDSDSESVPASISARCSLSFSSSSLGADHDELPRLSLDSEKPTPAPISLVRAPPRVSVARPKAATAEGPQAARVGQNPASQGSEGAPAAPLGTSAESPRVNGSGKVVFQGLGRSSSSPNIVQASRVRQYQHRGKPYRGMERSYSANRVAPVLHVVSVGSLLVSGSKAGLAFGLDQLFSPHKKERDASFARWNGCRSRIGKEKT